MMSEAMFGRPTRGKPIRLRVQNATLSSLSGV